MEKPQEFLARVERMERVTPKVVTLSLRLRTPPSLTFRAGQFCMLLIGQDRRPMSMSSPPSQKGMIALCADITPMGVASSFLLQLKRGDTVRFLAPYGVFTIAEDETRSIEFIATGAGIAPIRSMILDALEREDNRSLRLTFGNHDQRHMLFDEEFRQYAERHASFTYVPILSKPLGGWDGATGRVTDQLRDDARDLTSSVFYISGTPDMVEDVGRTLTDAGVSPSEIHGEKFVESVRLPS